MMKEVEIDVVQIDLADFTTTPGGRYRKTSKFSAEEFRDDHVAPVLADPKWSEYLVAVNLAGVAGITPSFIEELFGGLIRKMGAEVQKRIALPEPIGEDADGSPLPRWNIQAVAAMEDAVTSLNRE